MRKILCAVALLAFAGATDVVYADEAPASKMPEAGVVEADGWYLSGDVAWQATNLPDYTLGFQKVINPTFSDGGSFQSLDQHLDGYRLQGAVGYFLPSSVSDALMATNTRVEVTARYARATGGASGVAVFTDGGILVQTPDGAGANAGYICGPFQVCTVTSGLSTEHSDWQLGGKIAGEYRMDAIALVPSLTIFGGETQTDQTMFQSAQIGINVARPTYAGDTSLRSTDYGMRAGVDLTFDVTPELSLGLGGSAGFASRHASYDGSAVVTDTLLGLLASAGTASDSDNATPFVANTEVSAIYKLLPSLALRGFAGLDYDSQVAGIDKPGFGGVAGGVTSRTPARISFHSEYGYYAGGGITWSF